MAPKDLPNDASDQAKEVSLTLLRPNNAQRVIQTKNVGMAVGLNPFTV